MPKKQNESLTEYRDRVIDAVSPSYCAAKWYNATTWLGSGTTASCHHPPAHRIPIEEIRVNSSAIHNTQHKKLMRKMMLEGERPRECEYCWKVEDIGKNSVSDRVFKTIIYSDEAIAQTAKEPWDHDAKLKTFEISFDRVCNLACSYCNASFSTAWARDIKQNGPYQNMVSDGAAAFQQDGSWAQPYKSDEDNPYIKAFWDWWDNGLADSLEELRVTGGEPLMSSNTWKLFDWFESQDNNMRFAINSNLIAKDDIIDRLIEKSKGIKHFELYTSCEAMGKHAEYIRDGLDFTVWYNNITRVANEANIKNLHIMMTINSLCLFSITEFLDMVLEMKRSLKVKPTVSVNLLRFPSFQSPLALPDHIKEYLRDNISSWYETVKFYPEWHEFEKASIERLIDYLETVDAPHRRTSNKVTLWRDFKTFYKQYDERRNKSLDVFPRILTDWVETIPDTEVESVVLVNGDSSTQWDHDEQLQELAKKEGWVLKPEHTNIDDPKATYD